MDTLDTKSEMISTFSVAPVSKTNKLLFDVMFHNFNAKINNLAALF